MTDYPLGEGFATVDGMRLQYVEAGPSDGPPLVFLHGIGGGIEDWWANLGYFGELGYHVFAPSSPGHGTSDYPRDGWDPGQSGKTIIGLMDAWGIETASLIGHSAGGISAILAALENPERVTGLVLASPGGLTRRVGWPLRLVTIPLLGEALWHPRLLAGHRARKTIFADEDLVNRRIMDEWVLRQRDSQQRKAFFKLLREGLTIQGLKDKYDLRRRMRGIHCPTLIIWGREDIIVPPPETWEGRLVSWPEASFLEVSPSGHWPQVEQAEVFNREASTFLERVAAVAES